MGDHEPGHTGRILGPPQFHLVAWADVREQIPLKLRRGSTRVPERHGMKGVRVLARHLQLEYSILFRPESGSDLAWKSTVPAQSRSAWPAYLENLSAASTQRHV